MIIYVSYASNHVIPIVIQIWDRQLSTRIEYYNFPLTILSFRIPSSFFSVVITSVNIDQFCNKLAKSESVHYNHIDFCTL